MRCQLLVDMSFLYLSFSLVLVQVIANSTRSDNIVLIGHIGAIGALPNYEKVLELSRKELLEDGTLGKDFDIEIISRNGCGDALEGVAAAADLYHVEHVTTFLGPYCTEEMIAVATMANYWNIPIIAYMATANSLSDKKIYKTLVRTSLRTMNTIAESTAAFVKHYKWRKVTLVSNIGASAYEKIMAFEPVLKRRGITVTKKILFEESVSVQDMLNGGQMEEITSNSRIVIVMFSSAQDLTAMFREATVKYGLSETEYVFIFPWLQEGANGASPFVGSDSSILEKVKKTYTNCVLIDDTNGFDDRMITPFVERLRTIGLDEKDIDLSNIYAYIALFDAYKMFGTAGRRILKETGKISSVIDGKKMWNTMRRMTVPGMVSDAGVGSGTVMLDDLAERVPYYSAFFVDGNRNQVTPFANMAPMMIANCDGLKTGTGCFEINVTEVLSSFWPSTDGQFPVDEPVCGFRGEKCDYTLIIVGISATVCVILAAIGAWCLRRYWCAVFCCRSWLFAVHREQWTAISRNGETARSVALTCSDGNRQRRQDICTQLLSRSRKFDWLDTIVTGDEKWILYVNPTPKSAWCAGDEIPDLFVKGGIHEKKVMLSVWWVVYGIYRFELLPGNAAVTADVYCAQLQRLADKIRKEHPKKTSQKILEHGWEVLPHPPYSSDLAPSDYHLFRSLQHHLEEKRYDDRDHLENDPRAFFASKTWSSTPKESVILESKSLDSMPWRIFRDDMQLVDEEQAKSMLSLNSQKTKLSSSNAIALKHHAIIGVNTHATYHMYEQRRPIKFARADLILLMRIKQAVHDNLNPFLGMAFNEKAEMLLFWKFCSRGTLQDIIYNDNFVLDEKFHGAFLRDITLGLEYLHLSNIGFHGSLTTWSTLIDRNWLVKLTDYGISDAVRRWVKHGSINEETVNDGGEKTEATQKTAILYVAPEIRLSNEKNKNRRLDQAWIGQTLEKRRSADIYAFGVVMYEILFRNFPFSDKTDLNEMSTKAMEGEKICRPQVQKDKQLHPDLQALLQDCWHDSPDARPTIRRVRLSTESILKTKGSLVDSMTRMMEEYANNLEKLVSERTGMLEQATVRADKLLSQLLPKYVANELKNGRPVPPKLYTSATVFFSDVVGFTTLCSSSSPIEVVNLLNSVYSGFDEIINKRDGYKVETIGDAYMVVSGVPEENGRRHICNIADISLEIMEFLVTYRIPHRKSERLVIRVGFHSGSVAAAVVGLNSPRYCLFGDTVNLASRMESTGEPGKIQISQESKDLLANDYPEFVTVKRGTMEVKGKGERTTYWLLSKDRSCFNT
ncbi:hypothetical protein RB195_003903 [Necator americanus]|uniref:guanylate cyclase n=1 Tax=Necator americanus TaxID=51031 RepID=A0ABR1DR90_NECAM